MHPTAAKFTGERAKQSGYPWLTTWVNDGSISTATPRAFMLLGGMRHSAIDAAADPPLRTVVPYADRSRAITSRRPQAVVSRTACAAL